MKSNFVIVMLVDLETRDHSLVQQGRSAARRASYDVQVFEHPVDST
jgi:hypothetical protein